jgi:hypothetical protein
VIESLGYETAAHFLFESVMGSVTVLIDSRNWKTRVDWALHRRHYLRTNDGVVGLVPDAIEEGDIIVILRGGPVPYVLRPKPSGLYRFVEECYIYGMMHGEKLQDMEGKEGMFRIK